MRAMVILHRNINLIWFLRPTSYYLIYEFIEYWSEFFRVQLVGIFFDGLAWEILMGIVLVIEGRYLILRVLSWIEEIFKSVIVKKYAKIFIKQNRFPPNPTCLTKSSAYTSHAIRQSITRIKNSSSHIVMTKRNTPQLIHVCNYCIVNVKKKK